VDLQLRAAEEANPTGQFRTGRNSGRKAAAVRFLWQRNRRRRSSPLVSVLSDKVCRIGEDPAARFFPKRPSAAPEADPGSSIEIYRFAHSGQFVVRQGLACRLYFLGWGA